MRELRDIAARAASLHAAGEPFAVATVVRVDGSAYRREGARMLVERDGRVTGAVSGGCLEGEVIEQAREVLTGGTPQLVQYRLGADDPVLDAVLGFGTGCDGTVSLLLELGTLDALGPLAITASLGTRRVGTLATVFMAEDAGLVGCRRLALGGTARSSLPTELEDTVVALDDLDRPAVLRVGGADLLVEPIQPPLHLAVFGHGPDAVPIVRAAAALGWMTTVLGTRPGDELAERFAEADRRVTFVHPEDALDRVRLDAWSAAVVLTHNYLLDRDLLRLLLLSSTFYVGALGSQGRAARLRADLEDAGLSGEAISHLRSPVGLDLGAETPEEIAVSVVSEVLAVKRGRAGGPMRTATRSREAVCRVPGR